MEAASLWSRFRIFLFKWRWLVTILGGLVGAAGGYLYYIYVGCISGTCPITSSVLGSTGSGAVFGVLVAQLLIPDSPTRKTP